MRIDAYGSIGKIYNIGSPKKVSGAKKTEGAKDSYVISDEAKTFSAVRAAVAEAPDIREGRVSELKSAYENGTYNVSASDIADKLLEDD